MLKDAVSSKEESSHEFANRFGALDVEDLDECLKVATVAGVIQTKKLAKGHDIDVHEPEGLYEIDHAFKVFCFSDNLHRLQNALKETWKGYEAAVRN